MTSVAEELLKENQRFKEGLASIEKDLLRVCTKQHSQAKWGAPAVYQGSSGKEH